MITATILHEVFWGALGGIAAVVFVCWLSTTDWWEL